MIPTINLDRLLARLQTFNRIGAIEGGGTCRLALTDADRDGRELLVGWMRELDLAVTIDAIGNIIGVRGGLEEIAPVMFGSHIDTVATGGCYDGLYGVLAGIEALEALAEADVRTRRPLALASFTNEEGSRFSPYAMGSLVYAGGLALDDAYAITGIDGCTVGDELRRIGYCGAAAPGWLIPHAYVELHIEQGPVLEDEGRVIGVVEGIPGLAWIEVSIAGRSSHAGATPMHLRRDAAYAAGEIAVFVRRLANELGGTQRGTVGRIEIAPNLVNVVAERAVLTIDLRNMEDAKLVEAEARLSQFLDRLAAQERLAIVTRSLARFPSTPFDPGLMSMIETVALERQLASRHLPSGAGHDAQMMARLCPSAMIFVPSVNGLSHNVNEDTRPENLKAGAEVLLETVCRLAR